MKCKCTLISLELSMTSLSLKENTDDFKKDLSERTFSEIRRQSGFHEENMHACVRVCTSTTGMAFIVVHMQKGPSWIMIENPDLRFCFASEIVSVNWY